MPVVLRIFKGNLNEMDSASSVRNFFRIVSLLILHFFLLHELLLFLLCQFFHLAIFILKNLNGLDSSSSVRNFCRIGCQGSIRNFCRIGYQGSLLVLHFFLLRLLLFLLRQFLHLTISVFTSTLAQLSSISSCPIVKYSCDLQSSSALSAVIISEHINKCHAIDIVEKIVSDCGLRYILRVAIVRNDNRERENCGQCGREKLHDSVILLKICLLLLKQFVRFFRILLTPSDSFVLYV
mmetsp:Transcript_32662/g.55600  ORF Transcript_32662/g.55600 Transcript_32662/m.55600 type:complete len:237 (+) Transcript_32662:418-1128(+)